MKTPRTVLHLSISKALHSEIVALAKEDRRPIGWMARDLIEESIKWRKMHPPQKAQAGR
jgi:hypothetical protein